MCHHLACPHNLLEGLRHPMEYPHHHPEDMKTSTYTARPLSVNTENSQTTDAPTRASPVYLDLTRTPQTQTATAPWKTTTDAKIVRSFSSMLTVEAIMPHAQ